MAKKQPEKKILPFTKAGRIAQLAPAEARARDERLREVAQLAGVVA